jgi:polygalacturonase
LRLKISSFQSLPVAGVTAAVLLLGGSAVTHAAASCDVRAFGAKGDGVTKDTGAIQKAIDSCESKGGGTVRLSAGTYLSAPIELKSNITLQLDKGATLLGSPNHEDYPEKTELRMPDVQPLVSAQNASNISIVGEGTIDGNGSSWWEEARKIRDHGVLGNHPRPKLIIFDHCQNVRMEGVTVQNSPMWQIVPYYSDNVVIRNVKILAPQHSPNTDAIDPFSSSNVIIDRVYSDVGDDNVAIKSGAINSPGPDSPSRDIHITDCVFMHGHGLSVGSEIAGGAQNITAERVRFEGTDNGIRVKANRDRGNDVSNLVFRDLEMKDVKNAVIISEYYPGVLPPADEAAQPVDRLTPRFHNITIENLTATGSTNAGVIVGLPESPVRDVVLNNVKISAENGMTVGYASVTGANVSVEAGKGDAIKKLAGAEVTLH